LGSAARSTIGRSELPVRPPGPARAGVGGEVPRSRSGQEIQPSRCRCHCPSVPASLCGIVAIEPRGSLLRHVAARFWRGGRSQGRCELSMLRRRSMGPIARGGSSAKVASRPPRTEPPFLMARDTITRSCVTRTFARSSDRHGGRLTVDPGFRSAGPISCLSRQRLQCRRLLRPQEQVHQLGGHNRARIDPVRHGEKVKRTRGWQLRTLCGRADAGHSRTSASPGD
jgi:hypothetical protein